MSRPRITCAGAVVALVLPAIACRVCAQDFSVLRINEVLPSNHTRPPADADGGAPDMVEIYNGGDEPLEVGSTGADRSVAIGDLWTLDYDDPTFDLWPFPPGTVIPPKRSIVIFFDGQVELSCVELHATFELKKTGEEPVTLWGPKVGEDKQGRAIREMIDGVWLPPLREDVSFGRYPDGAGPAPVPFEDTFEFFRFNPPEDVTFGQPPPGPGCITTGATCPGGRQKRFCFGEPNRPGGNLEPLIVHTGHSTHAPEAGEAVELVAEVRDDKAPLPPNIGRVHVRYRVIAGAVAGEWRTVAMTLDAALGEAGLLIGTDVGRPTDRWSVWRASIPGQAAGVRVEFYLEVEDAEGLVSTQPYDLCFRVLVDEKRPPLFCDVQVDDASEIGPCDAEFGGPGCIEDPCFFGRFVPCDVPWSYAVGYGPRGDLEGLVVTTIVPAQRHEPRHPTDPVTGLLRDPTSVDPALCGFREPPEYCCGVDDEPSCGYEDFIEIHNASDARADLSGLWLSDRFFEPRRWSFPPGSVIEPRETIVVWCDDDGGKCPDPTRPPCIEQKNPQPNCHPTFWECPDPNDPAAGSYHTNFELDADGDRIFLLDTEENGFGVIHGTSFDRVGVNRALVLCPVDREGNFHEVEGDALETGCQRPFRRGDANGSGAEDISDGSFTLNYLFLGGPEPDCRDAADADDSGGLNITDAIRVFGHLFLAGPAPPAPGPSECGLDPTPDDLGCVTFPPCN